MLSAHMLTVVIAIYVVLQKQVAEVESPPTHDATSNKRKYGAAGSFEDEGSSSSDDGEALWQEDEEVLRW